MLKIIMTIPGQKVKKSKKVPPSIMPSASNPIAINNGVDPIANNNIPLLIHLFNLSQKSLVLIRHDSNLFIFVFLNVN